MPCSCKINEWLLQFGYADTLEPSQEETIEAVKRMQQVYGLKEDGVVGPITNRAMGLFRCGHTDRYMMRVDERNCKWRKDTIEYYCSPNFRLPGISTKKSIEIIRQAADSWENICGLTIKTGKYRSQADVIVDTGAGSKYYFDGPGNVLAWAEMPCAEYDTDLDMCFDEAEPWSANLAKKPGVLALAVATHEWGHILGLDHSRDSGDLMAPYYNPAVFLPQQGDTRVAEKLYGKSKKEGEVTLNVSGVMTVKSQDLNLALRYDL